MRILPKSKKEERFLFFVAKINFKKISSTEEKGTIIPENYQTWLDINMEESMNQHDLGVWSEGHCVDESFLDKPVTQRRSWQINKEGKHFRPAQMDVSKQA